MSLLFGVGLVLLLLVGGRQVVRGTLTLGEFVQFKAYLFLLQWPMLALGWTANLFQRGMASWRRIRSILNAEPAIHDGPHTDYALKNVSGDIEFRGIRLNLSGRPLLEHINVNIPTGTIMGMTGPTGSGKTMLAFLLARLLDPSEGQVLVGGRDIRAFPLSVLREHIGFAPQEPFLFSDTLAANIAFGMQEIEPEKVRWAAEIAQLRSEVELFPGGFDTLIGERGVSLSGGQRQRTAISRAIAKQAEILILDDTFSAIDTQTEARILAQLPTVLKNRTAILISHRVSTLKVCDEIIVLEKGRLTQRGRHDELVKQPGYYQELDEVQRLEARLEAA
jgi:ATP-binding cassette subfamily B protein